MAVKSVSERIKMTKTGKMKRRPRGLGHSKTNKTSKQLLRKKRERTLHAPKRVVRKYFQL